ncbi:RIO1 family regulatory kinase/ATPase [Vibrio mediterranei]|uniref:Uncharacterized protein n=1 Tax=Vibrio mediterranei TaxID=689 RepID=A0ABX5DCW3_9VIBR|nr:RIO1 family regulatory kinase/ATPase [Vibrio mediterranei]PCD87696.1 hypothetical protein COR52_14955 [Vibrio mediterranei]PRQ67320.1 hypothetical protein COR51_12140 [Vibrio mediterranei]
MNSNEIFIKKFEGYSFLETKEIYEHSLDIYGAVHKYCHFPKPLVLNNNEVHYEFLKLPEDMCCILSDTDNEKRVEAFYQSGKVLALIHSQNDLLHGDYVLHNLMYDAKEGLYIIDPHPPEVIGYQSDYLYGDPKVEYYFYLMSICRSYGIKNSLKRKDIIISSMVAVAKGYSECDNAKDGFYFNSYLSAVKRFLKINSLSGFSALKGLVHTIVSSYFLFKAIKKHD